MGAYETVCETSWGRARVKAVLLDSLAGTLGWRFALDEISSLTLPRVELRGVRIETPRGEPLLRAARVEVRLSLSALIAGELRAEQLVVDDAWADVRGLIYDHSVRPAAPSRKAPQIALSSIRLHKVTLAWNVPGQGLFQVGDIEAQGAYRQDAHIAVELAALQGTLVREGVALGRVEKLHGRYVSGGARSAASLRAQVSGQALRLQVSADPGVSTLSSHTPLSGTLELEALDQALLHAWGAHALASRFKQPLNVSGTLAGTLSEPRVALQLRGPAGQLWAEVTRDARRNTAAQVRMQRISLAAFDPRLPAGSLSGTLLARSVPDPSRGGSVLSAQLRDGMLDDAVLPSLQADARMESATLSDVHVVAQGYGADLHIDGVVRGGVARGKLSLSLPNTRQVPRRFLAHVPRADGAVQLHADFVSDGSSLTAAGELRVRSLSLRGAHAGSISGAFEAHGSLPAPQLSAKLALRDLRYANHSIRRANVQLRGGPQRYALALNVDATSASARADLQVEFEAGAVILSGGAEGIVLGRPLRLRVSRAQIGHGGSVALSRVVAQALGQTFQLTGRFGRPTDPGLTLRIPSLHLARLGAAVGSSRALQGEGMLCATLRGTHALPQLQVTLSTTTPNSGSQRPFALELQTDADTQTGRAALRLTLKRAEQLDVGLTAQIAFVAGEASWSERLHTAQLQAELDLRRLQSELLDAALTTDPLPLRFDLTGQLQLQGELLEPTLRGALRGQLEDQARQYKAALLLEPRYERGTVQLELSASDAHGSLLRAHAELAHPGHSTVALLREEQRLLEAAALTAQLDVPPRPIGGLPLPRNIDEDARRILLGLRARGSRAPGQEPTLNLTLSLNNPNQVGAGEDCKGRPARIELNAALAAGRLHAALSLFRLEQRLLQAQAQAALTFPAAGAQGPPFALRDLHVNGTIEPLDLASLPYVCGQLQGRLSGSFDGQNLFTSAPTLSAALRGAALRIGGPTPVDGDLRARVVGDEAQLDLAMAHAKTRSSAAARIPLLLGSGTFKIDHARPLQAMLVLDHFPAATFVPNKSPVSRVSGTLSGQIAARGTWDAPKLQGYLQPHAVRLTITSIAQPVSHIEGRVDFSPGRVHIERLSARDGPGTLHLRGSAQFAQGPARDPAVRGRFWLRAEGLPVRHLGKTAGDLNANLQLDVNADEQAVNAVVHLKQVDVWLGSIGLRSSMPLALHPDIVDPRAAQRPPPPAAALGHALHLNVVADDSMSVRRTDFATRVSARVAADVGRGQPLRMRGNIVVRRGQMQLFGKGFEILPDSRVDFVGASPPNPEISIQAVNRSNRSGQAVGVKITGRLSAPKLEFTLDDKPVTAGEAARALLGGASMAEGPVAQVQSFVGGLLGGVLATSVHRQLGALMPVVTVDDTPQGSTLRTGFELSSIIPPALQRVIRGLYIEGILSAGSKDQNQEAKGGVTVEVYWPHDLVSSGLYGPGSTWSVDFGWQP